MNPTQQLAPLTQWSKKLSKIRWLTSMAIGTAFLILTSIDNVSAQDIAYSDPLSEVYLNIVTVDDASFGPGYLLAATSMSSGVPSPELTRIDAAGGVLWKRTYSITGTSNFRLTDAEIVEYGGTDHYLLTGSVVTSSGQNDLFLMIVDLSGAHVASQLFDIGNYSHSVGLNCIQSTNGTYAVVGMSHSGSTTSSSIYDNRETIVLLVDQTLATFQTISLNTPSISTLWGPVDYDMGETIVETSTPERFFITGKVNGPQSSPAYGAAMSSVVLGDPMTAISVVWDNHISLSHDAVGADAVYYAPTSEVWLLSNNSASHMPNVTIIDEATGSITDQADFFHSTASSVYDLDHYGFDLHLEPLANSIIINIVGWHISPSGNTVDPFILHTNYNSGLFSNAPLYFYNFANTNYDNFFEDSYLAPFFLKQMPNFTPTLSDTRHSITNSGGYSILGIEGTTSPYTRKLIGVDQGGIAGNPPTTCTLPQGVPFNTVANPTPSTLSSTFSSSIGTTGAPSLPTVSMVSATLVSTPCNAINFGPNEALSIESNESEANRLKLFPNPAKDHLSISGIIEGNAYLALTDLNGKRVLEYTGNVSETHDINISALDKGIYFLQVTQGEQTRAMKFVKE